MLRFLLISLSAILFVHLAASLNFWYEKIWWFDIPMHWAGGAWLGVLFVHIFESRWQIFDPRKRFLEILVITLGLVALVGIFWEFAEYFYDIFIASRPFHSLAQKGLFDILKDLANDLIGGTIAVFIFQNSQRGRSSF